MNRTEGLAGTVRAVVHGVRSDRITFIAASLAYYAFISLLPLLLLALVVASLFGGPALADRVGRAATNAFGAQAGQIVENALTNAAGRGGATIFGVVVLTWSALKLFRGLDVAFSTVYGTVGEETFVDQFRNGLVTLVAVGVGVGATVAVGAATARLDAFLVGIDVLNVVGTVVLLSGLTVTLLPLYYVLPARGVTVREALPGAAFAAVGWTLLQTGFRVYTGLAGSYEAYGVLGGVLLLVTFLYFGGLVLLVGVVLNATLAGRIDEDTDLDAPEEYRDRDREGMELSLVGDIGEIDVDDDEALERQVRRLREELAEFETSVDERTVHREEIERDLKRYVRSRLRAGKARGWGPYLVLLYGTTMTLGAFFLLSDLLAVIAMVVVWLSTLGLYSLMLLVGATLGAASLPGRLKDRVSDFRE